MKTYQTMMKMMTLEEEDNIKWGCLKGTKWTWIITVKKNIMKSVKCLRCNSKCSISKWIWWCLRRCSNSWICLLRFKTKLYLKGTHRNSKRRYFSQRRSSWFSQRKLKRMSTSLLKSCKACLLEWSTSLTSQYCMRTQCTPMSKTVDLQWLTLKIPLYLNHWRHSSTSRRKSSWSIKHCAITWLFINWINLVHCVQS
jgi:hypothetical protein